MQEKEKEVLRYMKYSDFRVIVDSLKQNTAGKNEMDPATKKDEDSITFISSPGGACSL